MLSKKLSLTQEFKELLNNIIIHVKSIHIRINSTQDKLYAVFLKRLTDLAESILILIKKKRYYDSCTLTASLIEGYILIKWIMLNNRTDDYIDYCVVEEIPISSTYIHEKEIMIKNLESNNAERFFTHKKKMQKNHQPIDLLDFRNYTADWKNIHNIVHDLSSKGDKDIEMLKFNYDRFCLFKHSASYVLLPYALNYDFETDVVIALGTVCKVLFDLYDIIVYSNPSNTAFMENHLGLKTQYNKLFARIKNVAKEIQDNNF